MSVSCHLGILASELWLEFVAATEATLIVGYFSPGTFTNQADPGSLPGATTSSGYDPRADHQPLAEASYVDLPTIALCNTDAPLCCADIAILGNTRGSLRGSEVVDAGP